MSTCDLSASGTYIIRKGRRKERTPFPVINNQPDISNQSLSPHSNSKLNELKRCSSTFDNIKSLLKEGLIEGLDETPPDFQPPTPPVLVRVISLPTLTIDETCQTEPLQIQEKVAEEPQNTELSESAKKNNLLEIKPVDLETKSCDVGVQVMDDLTQYGAEKVKQSVEESTQVSLEYSELKVDKFTEFSESSDSVVDSIDSKTEEALILKLQQDQSEDFSSLEDILSPSFGISCKPVKNSVEIAKVEVVEDKWQTANEITKVEVVPVVEEQSKESKEGPKVSEDFKKVSEVVVDKPPSDFNGMVEIRHHEFGPLPPSPVEEDDDEYSDVLRNSPMKMPRGKATSVPEPFYRCLEPPGSDPIGAKFLNRPCPDPPPHRDSSTSLKTRSMDAGFSRSSKNQQSNSKREVSTIISQYV